MFQYSHRRPQANTRLIRDTAELERHLGLKRWERQAQKAVGRRRGAEEQAGPLPCFYKTRPDAEKEIRPAYWLALFQGGFALVRYVGNAALAESGATLLRDGIPWEQVLPDLLNRYLRGLRVPDPFLPRRRLPAAWVEQALRWPLRLQMQWVEKLRTEGLLPTLPKLDAQSVAPWLRWEETRSRFMDFRDGKKEMRD